MVYSVTFLFFLKMTLNELNIFTCLIPHLLRKKYETKCGSFPHTSLSRALNIIFLN